MDIEEYLQSVEAREKAATQGPWRMFYDDELEYAHVTNAAPDKGDDDCDTLADCFNYSLAQDKANAEFIASSKQDIPNLLLLVRKYREALERQHPARVWDLARQHYTGSACRQPGCVCVKQHEQNCNDVDAALNFDPRKGQE